MSICFQSHPPSCQAADHHVRVVGWQQEASKLRLSEMNKELREARRVKEDVSARYHDLLGRARHLDEQIK
jgi:hypothetical protein